ALSLGLVFQLLEDRFQARHLVARLLQMLLEGHAQVLALGRPGHLRQSLEDLLLGVVNATQFGLEQILKVLDLHDALLGIPQQKSAPLQRGTQGKWAAKAVPLQLLQLWSLGCSERSGKVESPMPPVCRALLIFAISEHQFRFAIRRRCRLWVGTSFA